MTMPNKVLVTGATGYLGSRLCERMKLKYEVPYRALVRSWTRAAPIARLDSEMVEGDLGDRSSVLRALDGCDAVVHLAFRDGHAAAKETRILMEACRERGIGRVVHMSSMAVHGPGPGAHNASEDTATMEHYDEGYSDSKVTQEKEVQRGVGRGVPAVILRPTIIYGPYSHFVTTPVREAESGAVITIDGGTGICNAVYIDDVCDATLAALVSGDDTIGRAYFINGDDRLTWNDFTMRFAKATGHDFDVYDFSAEDVRRKLAAADAGGASNLRSLARLPNEMIDAASVVPAVDGMVRSAKIFLAANLSEERKFGIKNALRGAPSYDSPFPSGPMPDIGRVIREDVAIRFENARAKAELDWSPRHDFASGSALTLKWMEFAGMVPPGASDSAFTPT